MLYVCRNMSATDCRILVIKLPRASRSHDVVKKAVVKKSIFHDISTHTITNTSPSRA